MTLNIKYQQDNVEYFHPKNLSKTLQASENYATIVDLYKNYKTGTLSKRFNFQDLEPTDEEEDMQSPIRLRHNTISLYDRPSIILIISLTNMQRFD